MSRAAETPTVSVIIVNYNSTDNLRRCLDALLASTIADQLEIVVVDNASSDFDPGDLRRAYSSVHFMPQAVNTTWTGGNNLALEEASGEFTLLLNPDTVVEHDAIENAVGHLRRQPGLAGLGAYLTGPDGLLQRYYRRLPSLADVPVILFEPLFRHTRRGRHYLMLDESFEDATPVPQPPGAFLMLRRSATSRPLLDPGYFNFFSDVDLCRRLLRHGNVTVFPDVRSYHQRAGAGLGGVSGARRALLYHDLTWGLRRYLGPSMPRTARIWVEVLLTVYWATRTSRGLVRTPLQGPALLITAWRALRGHPPNYGGSR